jgi:hypothetical protein
MTRYGGVNRVRHYWDIFVSRLAALRMSGHSVGQVSDPARVVLFVPCDCRGVGMDDLSKSVTYYLQYYLKIIFWVII